MSLEQSIQELVAAIKESNELLRAQISGSGSVVGARNKTNGAVGKSAAVTTGADTPPTATGAGADAPAAKDKTSDAKQSSGEQIDFATQISEPIVGLCKAGKRTEAVALLAKYGAKAAKELKPADYPAVRAEIIKLQS